MRGSPVTQRHLKMWDSEPSLRRVLTPHFSLIVLNLRLRIEVWHIEIFGPRRPPAGLDRTIVIEKIKL